MQRWLRVSTYAQRAHWGYSKGFSSQSAHGVFVGGQYRVPENAKFFNVEDPATATVIGQCVAAKADDVNDAVERAHRVFLSGDWSRRDVRQRAEVMQNIAALLRENLPQLAELEVKQTGRSIREMKAQLGRLPEWLEYFAAMIRTHEGTVPPFFGPYLNYVQRVPLGVCAQLTPWNHPLLIAIKKIAPAIATGNSVVLKPSEFAPISVLKLAELCVQGGLPADVLNVVTGLGPETGIALCNHPHIRKVDLTGGTATGRAVGAAAGKNLSSYVAELGGKTPMLIFDDADMTHAINTATFAAFVASGQTCVTGSRCLIHKSIFDEVVDKLAQKASKIRLGDPFDMTTQMGPVISAASKTKILGMIERAKKEGGVVKAGGAASSSLPAPFDKGHYILPTVLTVKPQSEIAREEVFGPVLACYPFEDEQEAIQLANDSPYGLAASVYTKDIMRAHRVADQLDCGIVWINDHHRNDPSSPWGGVRDSGIGRENGFDALHEYTQSKSVVVRKDSSTFDWFEQPDARYG